jgi:hypothetical protein
MVATQGIEGQLVVNSGLSPEGLAGSCKVSFLLFTRALTRRADYPHSYHSLCALVAPIAHLPRS